MKKTATLFALLLAVSMVLGLTACTQAESIVGTWKGTVDLGGQGENVNSVYEGVLVDIIWEFREDKTFSCSVDEASLQNACNRLRENLKDRPDLADAFCTYLIEDFEQLSKEGTYSYTGDKLLFIPQEGSKSVCVAELNGDELTVTKSDYFSKAVLPLTFTR